MTVWPQYTMLALMAMSLGSSMDSGHKFLLELIAGSLTLGILYAGGFFTVLGWAP